MIYNLFALIRSP